MKHLESGVVSAYDLPVDLRINPVEGIGIGSLIHRGQALCQLSARARHFPGTGRRGGRLSREIANVVGRK
jgi:hypothetical protein